MPRKKAAPRPQRSSTGPDPFQRREEREAARDAQPLVHVFGRGIVCDTDTRGYATPQNRDRLDLVVDATEGFIPLWSRDVTLRWRFQQRSLSFFADPAAARVAIRKLFGEAVWAWGSAAPVRFSERNDAWDFEIAVRSVDRCSPSGCVLASAFFPDAGRHELVIYPRLFAQSRQEQVETLAHEIGHIFGLRHFFANLSETAWPSQIFGTHDPFSIMNYGAASRLTATDKADLKRLYASAWNGTLTNINGTPIRLVRPFHEA